MYESICQLIETNAVSEANQLLRDGWILISTFISEYGVNYVLGRDGGDMHVTDQIRLVG